jgi:hypothetical protein
VAAGEADHTDQTQSRQCAGRGGERRWRDFLDSWTDYNNGTRQVGAWMRQGLLQMGVKPDYISGSADL